MVQAIPDHNSYFVLTIEVAIWQLEANLVVEFRRATVKAVSGRPVTNAQMLQGSSIVARDLIVLSLGTEPRSSHAVRMYVHSDDLTLYTSGDGKASNEVFTTATKALTVLETSCDTIHLTWKAPVNTGGWSPVTDYAVYIELAEAVPFEDLLPSATDDASVKPLPHRMVARKTEILLTGLAEATEYVVMVLPRNLKGWGAKWSAPLRVATDEALLPPLKANAPAIRPDSTCGEAEVRIPAAAPTGACRAPNEYLLQVLADVSDGWVTLEHSVPGSIAHISGINADASFVVRLVAMNAYGTAPPSDSTALTPGPFGGRTASYGKLTMASAMDETTMDDGDGFDDDECSDPDGIDDDLGLNDFFVKADAGTMERGGNALATRSFRVSVSGEDDDDDEHGDGGRGGANGEAEMLSMLDDAGEEALLARVNAVLISTGAAPLNGMQTTTAAGGQGEQAKELWTETEDLMYEL